MWYRYELLWEFRCKHGKESPTPKMGLKRSWEGRIRLKLARQIQKSHFRLGTRQAQRQWSKVHVRLVMCIYQLEWWGVSAANKVKMAEGIKTRMYTTTQVHNVAILSLNGNNKYDGRK